MQKAAKIAEWKGKEVESIKTLLKAYSVLGVVDVTNLPSLQLKRIRHKLKGNVLVKMSKKRLIKIALTELGDKNLNVINQEIQGMTALIFSNEDHFKLYESLEENKSNAPAKAGQISPRDIFVTAGPTPFTPGPVISELNQLGIKTEVKEGKLHIKEDKLLVKEGEAISPKASSMLSKLGIEPMEIGLNLILMYSGGIIFRKNVLSINKARIIKDIKIGRDVALSLAMSISYISSETVTLLLKKAYSGARGLVKFKSISVSEDVKPLEEGAISERKVKEEPKSPRKYSESKAIKKSNGKEPKSPKKPPTSSELLKEVEEDIKIEEERFEKKPEDKRDQRMKEAEKIAQDILRGDIKNK